MVYASFWKRFLAYVIDFLVLLLPSTLLFLVISFFAPFLSGNFLFMMLIFAAIYWVYFFLFESSQKQATPGKLALGIKVVNADGEKPSREQIALRSAIKALFAPSPVWILFVVCAFTKNKQNIHDIAGKTYVVYK